jgi:hypothetical protein
LTALKTLVIWLAVLFHALFSLLLVVLGTLAMLIGPQALHLEMLPWTGTTLSHILLFGGLFGLLSVTLAILHKLRFVFFLWSLTIAALLSKNLIFSSYRFPPGDWRQGLYLILAAWFALLGALFLMRPKRARGPRKYLVK